MFITKHTVLVLYSILSINIRNSLADTSFDCNIAHLVVPLKNNTLDDGVALNRGVPLSVGNETEGCRITFTRHQLGFRDVTDCSADNRPGAQVNQSICIGSSGGVFDSSEAGHAWNTWTTAPDDTWHVMVQDDPPEPGARVQRGYGDVWIAGKKLPQVPIETWSYVSDKVRSVLGLAPNSTMMQALANASAIPGELSEIGVCYGSRSQSRPLDGNLTFGGYDAGCVKDGRDGKFVEYDFYDGDSSDPCSLQVRMKKVVLTYKNGTNHSLIGDSGSTVSACVDPIQNAFTFSEDMYTRWAELTQHPDPKIPPADGSPPYTDQTYPLSAAELLGTLTIELEQGYSVTIPNYELVSQERGSNAQGAYDVTNSSRLMAAVSSVNQLKTPVLGGVFLSQTYLRVDYRRGKFMLAHADTNLERRKDVVATCSSTGSSSKTKTIGLSKGAIAGITVGSVLVLIAIVAAAIMGIRKIRMNMSNKNSGVEAQRNSVIAAVRRTSSYETEAIEPSKDANTLRVTRIGSDAATIEK